MFWSVLIYKSVHVDGGAYELQTHKDFDVAY